MWKWIIAALGALAVLSRFAWLAKFIPGFGSFAGIASAVLSAVVAFVKAFCQGVTVIVTHPVTLVTVGFFVMCGIVGGFKIGKEFGDHVEYTKGFRAGATEVAATVSAKSAETVAAADEGRSEVEMPADKVALREMCNRSSSCRSRGK